MATATIAAWAVLAGCQAKPQAPPPASGPTTIRRSEAPIRVFSGLDEVPSSSFTFEGGPGSVRVTMEIEGSGSIPTAGEAGPPPTLNDVTFKAAGSGRISVGIRRPGPEHPEGRVTIRCRSGGEESSADFEPSLWFHLPGAIVTVESPIGEGAEPVAPGKEVVLGRYVARNLPRDLRVTFKAAFSRDPAAPRTKAGIKPPR